MFLLHALCRIVFVFDSGFADIQSGSRSNVDDQNATEDDHRRKSYLGSAELLFWFLFQQDLTKNLIARLALIRKQEREEKSHKRAIKSFFLP
jgi:hypothetical protein